MRIIPTFFCVMLILGQTSCDKTSNCSEDDLSAGVELSSQMDWFVGRWRFESSFRPVGHQSYVDISAEATGYPHDLEIFSDGSFIFTQNGDIVTVGKFNNFILDWNSNQSITCNAELEYLCHEVDYYSNEISVQVYRSDLEGVLKITGKFISVPQIAFYSLID